MNRMNFGVIIAVGAWGVFVGGVFFLICRDVARCWDEVRWTRDQERVWQQLRMSEEMCSVIVPDEVEAAAEARVWAEVADLEMAFALPAREPRRVL